MYSYKASASRNLKEAGEEDFPWLFQHLVFGGFFLKLHYLINVFVVMLPSPSLPKFSLFKTLWLYLEPTSTEFYLKSLH